MAASVSRSEIEQWFETLQSCCRAVDYATARGIFAEDVVAFGTRANVVSGLDNVQENQWMGVWPRIRDFTFDLNQLRWGWSGEEGWGVVTWTSTGFHADGTPYARPGRATVIFARRDKRLLAIHTHFSQTPVPA
ncbi:MAG TPA: nuclear transport factor 2 family protein [Chloroflexota bacterium]|nr:nuclear transport factor 2 family protein [Chloroflexota bacterium]